MFRDIVERLGATAVEVQVGSEGFANDNHPMGATIIGSDPGDFVVDGTCRSQDHDNLYMTSSAVFSSAACVNSTPTIAALSLRIGERVAARLE